MDSDNNDIVHTFQVQVPSFQVVYCDWLPDNQVQRFQEPVPAGKMLSTLSKLCKKTVKWVLCPPDQWHVVVIETKYKHLHGWANCVDSIIQVVKLATKMHLMSISVIVDLAHLVQHNAGADRIDGIRLEYNYVE